MWHDVVDVLLLEVESIVVARYYSVVWVLLLSVWCKAFHGGVHPR